MNQPVTPQLTAPQTVQLDPLLRSQVQIRTLQNAADVLTNELTFAHMQGKALEDKLAAAEKKQSADSAERAELVTQLEKLGQLIEQCGASEQLTAASIICSQIKRRLTPATP